MIRNRHEPRLRSTPILLTALITFASVATAEQAIYTCIDDRGAIAYQNAPCANGERILKRRIYVAPAPDPASLARSREIEREMDARNRRAHAAAMSAGRPVRATRQSRATDPCEAAKARRAKTLEEVGLKRDFDLLSRLDHAVWAACGRR